MPRPRCDPVPPTLTSENPRCSTHPALRWPRRRPASLPRGGAVRRWGGGASERSRRRSGCSCSGQSAGTSRGRWRDLSGRGQSLHVEWAWVAASVALYLAGLCAFGAFFARVDGALADPGAVPAGAAGLPDQPPGQVRAGQGDGGRAAGRAAVASGARPATAAFATLYETLTMMAAGGLVAAAGVRGPTAGPSDGAGRVREGRPGPPGAARAGARGGVPGAGRAAGVPPAVGGRAGAVPGRRARRDAEDLASAAGRGAALVARWAGCCWG